VPRLVERFLVYPATFTAARRVANIQHTVRYTELAPDLIRDIWRD
jgi:hypothetical protein